MIFSGGTVDRAMTETNQIKKQKTVEHPPRPQNIGIKGIEIYIPSQVCGLVFAVLLLSGY